MADKPLNSDRLLAWPADREAVLHFRDELRDTRYVALRDAEAFDQILFVLERIGVYLTGASEGLGDYEKELAGLAKRSPLAEDIPEELSDWHASFSTLYDLLKTARNDALHQGAYARHLTSHAVELSIVLEDALMDEATCARDFMVREVVRAFLWQPISCIRRTMLVNAFSYVPVNVAEEGRPSWRLLSDFATASYLRAASSKTERKKRMANKLREIQGTIRLLPAPVCRPEDPLSRVLELSGGLPVLVVDPEDSGDLRGIVTPFDVL